MKAIKTIIIPELKRNKGMMVINIFAIIFASLVGMAVPYVTKEIMDSFIMPIDAVTGDQIAFNAKYVDVNMIIWMSMTLLILIFFKVIGTFAISYWGRGLELELQIELTRKAFKHTERVNVTYIDANNEGKLLRRIDADSGQIAGLIRYVPENIFSAVLNTVITFTMVSIYDWSLSLILAGIYIGLILFTFLLRKRFNVAWLRVKDVNDEFYETMSNSVSGIKESKAYNAEEKEIAVMDDILDRLKKTWRRNFILYGKWSGMNAFILSMITFVILGYGSWRVMTGNLTVPELIAVQMYGVSIVDPINKILATFDLIVAGGTSLTRYEEYMNEPEEDYDAGKSIGTLKGDIKFTNVILDYPGTSQHALRGISFEVKSGQKVALVGETGSGKSTILKALLRFYEATEGTIEIDGKNIKEYNIKSIRENITYLQQDSYLFNSSIKSNIKYAIPSGTALDNDALEEILSISQSKSFIDDLPEKLATKVGPRGISLSGGQKQRIAIARALLKNSSIIMFDEATSALDNKTELEVQRGIEKIIKNKTSIFIAHRLSTIENVDKIFVLKHGQIIEQGTKKELLAMKGYFWELSGGAALDK